MTVGAACPIPTPDQARFGAALAEIKSVMLKRIAVAVAEAHEAAMELPPIQHFDPPLPLGYFVLIAHHRLFTTLCGAEPDGGKGGDPAVAIAVLRNFENLARGWKPSPPMSGVALESGEWPRWRLRKREPRDPEP